MHSPPLLRVRGIVDRTQDDGEEGRQQRRARVQTVTPQAAAQDKGPAAAAAADLMGEGGRL